MAKRAISGKDVIKILEKEFGFKVVRQRGSHVKLNKQTKEGKITTIVPAHKELAFGTISGILKLAKVKEEDFWERV